MIAIDEFAYGMHRMTDYSGKSRFLNHDYLVRVFEVDSGKTSDAVPLQCDRVCSMTGEESFFNVVLENQRKNAAASILTSDRVERGLRTRIDSRIGREEGS